jgi:hypothetical protein
MIQFAQPWFLKNLMNWVQSYGTDNPEPGYRGVLIAGKELVKKKVVRHLFLTITIIKLVCLLPPFVKHYYINNIFNDVLPPVCIFDHFWSPPFTKRHLY